MSHSPPPDTRSRERLLQAGIAWVADKGLRSLTVRAVAAQAEVNLGSFVYHFGTRDAFVDELIDRLYAPLMASLELQAARAADPLQKLRGTLLQLVAWVAAQRQFLAQLVLDAAAGEPGARRFLRTLDQRHPALLLRLIVQAQRAGDLQAAEPLHVLAFLMTSLAIPVLLFGSRGPTGLLPQPLASALAGYALEPGNIERRLDWALRGLATPDKEATA